MRWVMYKKGDTSLIREVTDRRKYHYLTHNGWGVITPARVGKKLKNSQKHSGLSEHKFVEFLFERVPDLPWGRRKLKKMLKGEMPASLSLSDLRLLAHACCHPVKWFTVATSMVPKKPWKHWDYQDRPRVKHLMSEYDVMFEIGGETMSMRAEGYDRHHARAAFEAEYPGSKVLNVTAAKVG